MTDIAFHRTVESLDIVGRLWRLAARTVDSAKTQNGQAIVLLERGKARE